jgi:hypothetical protein
MAHAMKAIASAVARTSPAPPPQPGLPFFFLCEHRRDGRQHFNFPAQLRAAMPMQCTLTVTRGLLVLAASMLLLSHPRWPAQFGRRRSKELARELAAPFAEEYLIPHAGRDWIISSSTVREFVADWFGEDTAGDAQRQLPLGRRARRALSGPRSSTRQPSGFTRGSR